MKLSIYIALVISIFACQSSPIKEEVQSSDQELEPTSIKVNDSTKLILSKILSYEHNFNLTLLKQFRDKGIVRGIDFCKMETLEKYIKSEFQSVKRISCTPVNPTHLTNKKEAFLKDHFTKPYLPIDTLAHTYFPIEIKEAICLSCHGTPYIDIQAKQYTLLKDKYKQELKSNRLHEIIGFWKIKR